MKKFLMKFLLYTGLLFCASLLLFLLWYFTCIYGKTVDNYDSAIELKVKRLMSLPSPKIILTGNSNLAFGIDSSLLEKTLNMPCVNLGLNGGMGYVFYEKIVSRNIGKGDIIILSYTHYKEEVNGPFVWGFYFSTPLFGNRLFPVSFLIRHLYALPTFMKYTITEQVKNIFSSPVENKKIYHRSSFNEYGDVTVLRPSAFTLDIPPQELVMEESTIKRLNNWHKLIRKKGAYLLAAGYPVYKGKRVVEKEKMAEFQAELQRKLSFPVISDFREYYFPPEYFFDSCFHLTKKGAEERTRILIKDIQRWKRSFQKPSKL